MRGVRLHALAQLAYEGIMDDLAAGGGAATNAAPASASQGGCSIARSPMPAPTAVVDARTSVQTVCRMQRPMAGVTRTRTAGTVRIARLKGRPERSRFELGGVAAFSVYA